MEDGDEETVLVEDLENSENSPEVPLRGLVPPVDTKIHEPYSKGTLSSSKRWLSSIKTRQTKYIGAIVATTSLGSLLWGYHTSIVAGAMLLIDDHYDLSILWHEVIVSIFVGGATIGAAVAGWLSDKFGRWKMMMCTAVLYGVGAIIMATSFSKFCLVVGRGIAGLALGMCLMLCVWVN